MSSFEDSDDDGEAMRRYAAARRRAMLPAATGGDGEPEPDTSWAVLQTVTAIGEIAGRLRFWHRPHSLEHLAIGRTVVTGVEVWPACIGLASVLERRGKALNGVTALELGSGVGVGGIVLAKLGATVTLTDNVPEVLTLLRRNVAENAVSRRCTVAHLAWERPELPSMGGAALDLIVGSDLVYGGPQNGLLLLRAIDQLIRLYGHPRTTVLLALGCRCRGTDEHVAFLQAAAAGYRIDHLEPDEAVAEESGVDGIDIVELRQVLTPG